MADNTRKTLLNRLQEGGSDADWEEFNDFYFGLVTAWARALGCSTTVAQDIYQNTLIVVVSKLSNFQHSGNTGDFRKWLKTIVRRRVIDHFRWEGKHKAQDDGDLPTENAFAKPLEEMEDAQPAEEATMDRIWLHQIMDQALATARKRVTPEKFETFRRYVIYERPVDEVSEETGVKVATIFQHKNSFLNTLREEFIRLLGNVHDLGPALRDEASAKKALKKALASYVQTKKQYRNTLMVEERPEWDGDRVTTIRTVLAENPPPGPDPHILLIDGRRREWFPLPDKPLTLGQDESCDIRPNADGVSALHAILTQEGDRWVIKDVNSTNGLWLNGRRIGEHPLHPGDWLQLGECGILFWKLEI